MIQGFCAMFRCLASVQHFAVEYGAKFFSVVY